MDSFLSTALRTADSPVFHYTSSQGLLGATSRHHLWASEAAGLNDLAEVRRGWTFIRDWLDKTNDSDVKLLRRLADRPFNAPHEVFVLCASTDGDDANQWRLYASGGRGYCVELDPTVPMAVASENAGSKHPDRLGTMLRDVASTSEWLHVLYDRTSTETALNTIVAELKQRADDTSGFDSQEEADEAAQALQADMYEALATVAHLIKAPGFRGENEVRTITTTLSSRGNVRYREGQHGVVGYVALAATPSGLRQTRVLPRKTRLVPLPLRSVRLGPLLQPENAPTVKALLRDRDYREVKVAVSQVPLR